MTTLKNRETKIFESRAKLMLTGEYLVLKGALSLSLPLNFTQRLTVEASDSRPVLHWQSFVLNQLWVTATFQLPGLEVIRTNSAALAGTLSSILKAARSLRRGFLEDPQGYRVTSEMNFDPAWGMGSSSSLVSNIAFWAECDPFRLNRMLSPGSGYDIACARSSGPVIYRLHDNLPEYRKARFRPAFHDNLWFVYLNRKQQTGQSIRSTDLSAAGTRETEAISFLTLKMEQSDNLGEFQQLMKEHETITGRIIRQEPVGEMLFDDFNGTVKSLGSWGGDFVLAASDAPGEDVRDYFISRNLHTIFRYREIVANGDNEEFSLQRQAPASKQL